MNLELSTTEISRYHRQIILPEIGIQGQLKLKSSRVLIVGAGGLGCPAALYLAAAGIGKISIVDFDKVDLSNLHRQILFQQNDLNLNKAQQAESHLNALNSDIQIVPISEKLSAENISDLVIQSDVILDCSDNFETRYLLNDACVIAQKPLVHASISKFEGQAAVFYAPHSACYRCLFPEPPPVTLAPNCALAGVLGVLPGILGVVQATEALKLILNIGEPLTNKLWMFNALNLKTQIFDLPKDINCAVCSKNAKIFTLQDSNECIQKTYASCQTNTAVLNASVTLILAQDFAELIKNNSEVGILDVRNHDEIEQFGSIKGALSIPLPQLLSEANQQMASQKQWVVYCQSGIRSTQACLQLQNLGYLNVKQLQGGYLEWLKFISSC